MLFSFVIPTYNRSHKVSRAIDSIISQPQWDLYAEIIVIDDGSTDDTELMLQKYLSKHQIKLVKHLKNKGVASAKNTGIIHAKNEYVVLLDSDDLLDKNGLIHLKNLVLQNKFDLFFCGTRILNETKLMYDPEFKGQKTYYDLLSSSVGEYLPVCKTQLMQNNLLRNLRGYESVTWLSLAKKGYKLFFDSEPIRLYDMEGTDRISNRFSGIKNSNKMRDGYALYLKEFGLDLKYVNYTEYLKINFKLFCYYLMSFSFAKSETE
ncbi:glycosyltransferase family 2 protein [Pedobacter cryophilus]|uniref:Glycosyltransferase n=1 Tax=Pedobacter cryophilus TaxID=2571271 RepID=A0A4U1C165_9SPHI|nr:glycosyltransferase family 2 protein [Pedobacter cryophilus]TKB97623.1 glycosyltransferase [Pedobacter cryophilus]